MPRPLISARHHRPIAMLGLLSILLAACGIVPGIGTRTWGLATTNQAGVDQTIKVTDTSGLVQEVEFDPAEADLFSAVTAPPGRPNTLDVTWTEGACDTATDITIAGRGQGLDIRVSITGGEGCDAFGTPRAIRLRLVQPIPPAAVTITE